MNPLITAILTYFILKETRICRDILYLIGTFGGIIVINLARIGEKGVSDSENNYLKGLLLTLVGLIFRSSAPVAIKHISKYVHSLCSPFYFSLRMFSHAVLLLIFCREYLYFEHYDLKTVLLFSESSIANYGAQTASSAAYSYEKATVLAPVSYVITCGLLLIDCFLFGYDFNLVFIIQ
ncbi:unnamed protein product [Moneuplotes crassus]|uniref:EamA domain-containing protein n=1 Tax=Euplotes crassus TaxID=5936 RepID=A0AAD2D1F8_EUPCR|nr:unnamed protein product [Moneuplotes crassus]